MSTKYSKLSTQEISEAFGSGKEQAFPPILTTKQAAELLRVQPKTINSWKNAGLLEGTYRQHRGQDLYWRDRLVVTWFNNSDLDGKPTDRKSKGRRKSRDN